MSILSAASQLVAVQLNLIIEQGGVEGEEEGEEAMEDAARPHVHQEGTRRRLRRPRVFKPRTNFLDMSDQEMLKRFRLDRAAILELGDILKGDLESRTRRCHAVPHHLKLLGALSFYANGSFQRLSGDRLGLSQSTISRAVCQVTDALVKKVTDYISLPLTTQQQLKIQKEFCDIAGFPRVLGAIDCTHVAIRAPSQDADLYIGHKKSHSVNMQVICDASGIIWNVCAKFPGSFQDSYILSKSSIYKIFESNDAPDGILLGDASYSIKPWLMTPVANLRTQAEQKYNEAHSSTWKVIKRTLGLLKTRFCCLDKSKGVLQYNPEMVCKIFVACCMLHNIAVHRRLINDQDQDGIHAEKEEGSDSQEDAPDPPVSELNTECEQDGYKVRNQLIDKCYS